MGSNEAKATKGKTGPLRVFFDANIFISGGGLPHGPIVSAITNLTRDRKIELITTNITIYEITAHVVEKQLEHLGVLGRKYLRDLAYDVLNIKIPQLTKDQIADKLWKRNHDAITLMFSKLNARVLSSDDVMPNTIFEMRSRAIGMFSGEQKREQIPDAFILELLKQDAKTNGSLILVSEDGDFDAATKRSYKVTFVKTILELFRTLKLEITETYLERFAEVHADELVKLSEYALSDRGAALTPSDHDDAEIEEVTVSQFDVISVDEFRTAEDELFVTGRAQVKAIVNYTRDDYDNAIWDSEDKRYIVLDTIRAESNTDIEFDFAMTVKLDKKKLPSRIADFQLGDENSISFRLDPSDDY